MRWHPHLSLEIAAMFAALGRGHVAYGFHLVRASRNDRERRRQRDAEAGRPVVRKANGRPAVVSAIGADPLDALLFGGGT